jgi:tetratricopeptide (TPR) repeat protein
MLKLPALIARTQAARLAMSDPIAAAHLAVDEVVLLARAREAAAAWALVQALRATEALAQHPELALRLDTAECLVRYYTDDWAGLADRFTELLAQAERWGDPDVTAEVAAHAALCGYVLAVPPARGLERARLAWSLARPGSEAKLRAAFAVTLVCGALSRFADAVAWGEYALACASRLQDEALQASIMQALVVPKASAARLADMRNQPDPARLTEALRLLQGVLGLTQPAAAPMCIVLADLLNVTGRHAEALDTLDDALPRLDPGYAHLRLLGEANRALAQAGLGQHDAARAGADGLLHMTGRNWPSFIEAVVVHIGERIFTLIGDTARAADFNQVATLAVARHVGEVARHQRELGELAAFIAAGPHAAEERSPAKLQGR